MKKYFFIIDVAKCWDCNNCFISCLDEHENNDWPGYTYSQPRHGHRWMNVMRRERGEFPLIDVAYRPTPCMHCQDAPCVAASGGAITCREDGIVLIDPDKAKGRRDLLTSCPYGAIYWNEEHDVPQKCTMCAHLLDEGWKQPRCAQACFTGALQMKLLDEAELKSLVREQGLNQLHPGKGTRPNVYYKNLYRYGQEFIAGSAVFKKDQLTECLEGASARLYQDGEVIKEVKTDAFGDFRFDKLDRDSGVYRVELEYEGRKTEAIQVFIGKSANLGAIRV